MIIKEVKFSYVDKKFKLGPYVDFCGELEAPSTEYEDIVSTIHKLHPEYEQVKVMSFTKK
jgi:hypothetical protein